MLKSCYFFIIFLLSLSGLQAEIVRTVERVFSVANGQGAVELETSQGALEVQTGDVDTIKIVVRQEYIATEEREADRLQRNLSLDMRQEKGLVSVKAAFSRQMYWAFENWPPVRLTFTLIVPQKCDLTLRTREGGIRVAPITGKCRAQTTSGTVFFQGVTGSVDARTDSGEIVVSHCNGDLRVRSDRGGFRIGPVRGNVEARGNGGELAVGEHAGKVVAETIGADLQVSFAPSMPQSAELKSDGASIVLQLPRQGACSLDLRSSIFGYVKYDAEKMPLEVQAGKPGSYHLMATWNRGGAPIQARASGGHVLVQPYEYN